MRRQDSENEGQLYVGSSADKLRQFDTVCLHSPLIT